ncbi:glycosyltransferase family 4 protein [Actinosynnema sp. NPDC020468]|uniref:glycosyltransferase family 4 protein n=1 Tax=Actinosynnema sp. NPDC020468 TaxID=3154488 RepID=UPI0033F71D2B
MTRYLVTPDLAAPTGGNHYDLRVADGFRLLTVPGSWPRPSAASRAALRDRLAECPDGSFVLLDGLVACGVPDVVVPHAGRVRLGVLVHLPLADETGLDPASAAALDAAERTVLRAASTVVATSPSTARRLAAHHGLAHVHSVPPGTDPAPLATGVDGVSALLVVASLTPRKGHDVLLDALSTLADVPWTCAFVGPSGPAEPAVRRWCRARGLGDRVRLTGPLTGAALAAAYDAADLFVLPSRAETFGMVVTEALARGLPVIASAVPDALDGGGVLVPPGDAAALADALRRWFHDPDHRRDLRVRAAARRERLSTWEDCARLLAAVAG